MNDVGIMADSHGRPETIAAGLAVLEKNGCRTIFHLGDICDSAHPETADACIEILRRHNISAILGNNDRTVAVNQEGREKYQLSAENLSFIQKLPLQIRHEGALFTHSLPFAEEMGLSAMVGVMGAPQALRFFRENPGGILFRGHSHTPEMIWQVNGDVRFQGLAPGNRVELSKRRPCVVTCGALTRGVCMAWSPSADQLALFAFPIIENL
jgi:predicted phosphodiesterase